MDHIIQIVTAMSWLQLALLGAGIFVALVAWRFIIAAAVILAVVKWGIPVMGWWAAIPIFFAVSCAVGPYLEEEDNDSYFWVLFFRR